METFKDIRYTHKLVNVICLCTKLKASVWIKVVYDTEFIADKPSCCWWWCCFASKLWTFCSRCKQDSDTKWCLRLASSSQPSIVPFPMISIFETRASAVWYAHTSCGSRKRHCCKINCDIWTLSWCQPNNQPASQPCLWCHGGISKYQTQTRSQLLS